MKKLVLILVAALALVGCGSKPNKSAQVLSCVGSEDGMEMEMDMTVENEKFTDISMKIVMPYEMMGLTPEMVKLADEKEVKALVEQQYSSLGKLELNLEEKAMVMSVAMTTEDFVKSGFASSADFDEKVNINELKESMETSELTCTIK